MVFLSVCLFGLVLNLGFDLLVIFFLVVVVLVFVLVVLVLGFFVVVVFLNIIFWCGVNGIVIVFLKLDEFMVVIVRRWRLK